MLDDILPSCGSRIVLLSNIRFCETKLEGWRWSRRGDEIDIRASNWSGFVDIGGGRDFAARRHFSINDMAARFIDHIDVALRTLGYLREELDRPGTLEELSGRELMSS